MVWKPDFDFFSIKSITASYPLLIFDDNVVISSVIYLVLFELIQIHDIYLKSDSVDCEISHMKKYPSWIRQTVKLTQQNENFRDRKVLGYFNLKPAEQIETLFSFFDKVFSETRLMSHIYWNFPDIVKGEKNEIQIAFQDNLLLNWYRDSHGMNENNNRLTAVIDFLSHSKPGLQILKIDADTKNAIQEILIILNENSIFRRYKSYIFTDVTISFLTNAQDKFKNYQKIFYSTFDMKKLNQTQNIKIIYDVVIAFNVNFCFITRK